MATPTELREESYRLHLLGVRLLNASIRMIGDGRLGTKVHEELAASADADFRRGDMLRLRAERMERIEREGEDGEDQ